MPLDKAHRTVAERTTLVLYPAFCAGMAYALLTPPIALILATPAFRVLADVMPIRTWGVMLALIAAAQTAALFVNRVGLYVHCLSLLLILMACWGFVFAVGAWRGDNLWTAVFFAWFVAAACWASASQLLAKAR